LSESSLGPIVVDADGRTLYSFEQDSDGIPTCYDACATSWPPFLAAEDSVAGDGLDSAALTEFERTDGTTQALYGGWPLYYFAGDSASGDTNGQGSGSVWWVVGADGEQIIQP
jgi:predicted lipoprotein with Yx(FWY)xxD motif